MSATDTQTFWQAQLVEARKLPQKELERHAAVSTDALRAAGYAWGAGAWNGYADKLPECVCALAEPVPFIQCLM